MLHITRSRIFRANPVIAGLVNLSAFFCLLRQGAGLDSLRRFGVSGLFVALLVGLLSTRLFLFFFSFKQRRLHLRGGAPDIALPRTFSSFLPAILPVRGLYVGVSGAMGFDGRGWGTSQRLDEWAVSGDLGYVKPDGPLEGAFVKLHYTEYRNGTDAPSWSVYKNGFQSEHDFKILMGIPFSF